MLGRTADNLYWTGRYVERAESLARILDVSHRIALQRGSDRAKASEEFGTVLSMLGDVKVYAEKHGLPTPEGVTAFVAIDPENPSSIHACVRLARENARALRAVISLEVWESINTTWIELRQLDEKALKRKGSRELCEWVKERCSLFRGATYGTFMRDDGFHFLELGTFLERADDTVRLLDTKYKLLEQGGEQSAATTFYEWGAVLHAVGAFRAYHRIYHDVITPARVASLLVTRGELPLSVRFCADQIVNLLSGLARGRDLECQRLAGELQARLRFVRMDRVLHDGLHEFLKEIESSLSDLSSQISKDFMMTV